MSTGTVCPARADIVPIKMSEDGKSDGGGLLIVLAAMFLVSFASGSLPSMLGSDPQRHRDLSALGGGLLLGTALSVVIPEGFSTLAAAREQAEQAGGHAGSESVPSWLGGFVLVVGFVGMLALERLGSHGGACPGHGPEGAGRVGELELGSKSSGHEHRSPLSAHGAPHDSGAATVPRAAIGGGRAQLDEALRTLLGLCVHCAADGLTLGAAAVSGGASVRALVGGAMVAHKAPMAFGFAAHLASLDVPRPFARRCLLAFSLAAPAAALASFLVLSALPLLDSPASLAACLLLSGGTFLQVATLHVLPGVLSSARARELIVLGGGALLPVLLGSFHGDHGHHH